MYFNLLHARKSHNKISHFSIISPRCEKKVAASYCAYILIVYVCVFVRVWNGVFVHETSMPNGIFGSNLYAWYTHTHALTYTNTSLRLNKKVRKRIVCVVNISRFLCLPFQLFSNRNTPSTHISCYFNIHSKHSFSNIYSILSFCLKIFHTTWFFFTSFLCYCFFFLFCYEWKKNQDPKLNHFACIRTFHFI